VGTYKIEKNKEEFLLELKNNGKRKKDKSERKFLGNEECMGS